TCSNWPSEPGGLVKMCWRLRASSLKRWSGVGAGWSQLGGKVLMVSGFIRCVCVLSSGSDSRAGRLGLRAVTEDNTASVAFSDFRTYDHATILVRVHRVFHNLCYTGSR